MSFCDVTLDPANVDIYELQRLRKENQNAAHLAQWAGELMPAVRRLLRVDVVPYPQSMDSLSPEAHEVYELVTTRASVKALMHAEAVTELAEIRALVGTSDRCAWIIPTGAPCNLAADDQWHIIGDDHPTTTMHPVTRNRPTTTSHPFTPESTADAVRRVMALVLTDEACSKAATVIVLDTRWRVLSSYEQQSERIAEIIKQARGAKS